MGTRIIVDGYNFLMADEELSRLARSNLEGARRRVISSLGSYGRERSLGITLVFDAAEGMNLSPSADMERGIKVVYTRAGQTADDLIEKMAKDASGRCVVVTSDRELAHRVGRRGAEPLSSAEFWLKVASSAGLEGGAFVEEDYSPRPLTTEKRGNPKRPSKRERRRKQFLKKL